MEAKMQERRIGKFWKIKYTLWFLNVFLVCITLLTIISFYTLGRLVTEQQHSFQWRVSFFVLQLCFIGIIFIFLTTMFLLLHRSLGPLPRLERILDKIIQGDYTLRLSIRKRDIIHSFIDKVNSVIALLEEKSKSK
jgi:methyl-accepting chemotaxis protein